MKALPMFLRRGHRIDRSTRPDAGTHPVAFSDEEFEVLETGSLAGESWAWDNGDPEVWDRAFEHELAVGGLPEDGQAGRP